MNRRLGGRLFHIPMLVMLCLITAAAGALFLTGHYYLAAVPFVILAVLFYLVYGLFVVPRIYTDPARRLVQVVQTLRKGGADVTWGTGFSGELLDLRIALESLIDTLRPAGVSEDSGRRAAADSDAVMSLEGLALEVSGQARAVTGALESVTAGCGEEVNTEALSTLEKALKGSRNLGWIAENLHEMSRLEKAGAPSPEEFWFCDLMKEIEDEAAVLAGNCGVALITACDDSLARSQVYTDRACLRGLLGLLVREGLAACGEGTVTVLASLQKREQDDCLELCIAHSERRLEDDAVGRGTPEGMFLRPGSVSLCLARRSCRFLGGSMEVEQSPGRGDVVTILLPARLTPTG